MMEEKRIWNAVHKESRKINLNIILIKLIAFLQTIREKLERVMEVRKRMAKVTGQLDE